MTIQRGKVAFCKKVTRGGVLLHIAAYPVAYCDWRSEQGRLWQV